MFQGNPQRVPKIHNFNCLKMLRENNVGLSADRCWLSPATSWTRAGMDLAILKQFGEIMASERLEKQKIELIGVKD